MRDKLLPFSVPSIGEDEISAVAAALRSGWITTGPRTREFEEEFARLTNASAALGLNSGTAALHLALAAVGAGPGTAVIASAMTFCAGVHVIEQVGARPILVDIDPETLNIDPAQVDRATRDLRPGERLAAIMPVHLHGQVCDRSALLSVAKKHGCALIEDAAHAFPIESRDKYTDIPVLTAFSFYATKNLTTGEGGMLTGPRQLIDRARLLSLHGMTRDIWNRDLHGTDPWAYDVTAAGFKYNMSDILAAIGLAQLCKTESLAQRRLEIATRYNRAFSGIEGIQIPGHGPNVGHTWHIYAMRLHLERLSVGRSEFMAGLRKRNVATSVHFIPIHLLSYYAERYGFRPDDFPVAHREYQRLVSLPIYPAMTDADIEDVIEAVIDAVGEVTCLHAAVEA